MTHTAVICPACGGAGEEMVLTTETTMEVRRCATCEGKGYVALNVSDLKVYVPYVEEDDAEA